MSDSLAAADSPSLRKTAIRRGLLAIVLMCVVAFGLVFPFPFEGRLSGDAFDLAHAPVFCFALLCLIGFCDPAAIGLPARFATIVPMNIGRVIAITFALMIVGIVGEYAQKFAGRYPSWSDVLANSTGMLAALLWIASRSLSGPIRYLLLLVAVSLMVAISRNPVRDIWDSIQQIRSFPMLSSFERSRELGSWARYKSKFERSTEWASHGEYSLKATMPPGEYPGVGMVWFQHDWREYSRLQLDLMNPGDTAFPVTVKIFDEYHTRTGFQHNDRFGRDYTLEPGANVAVDIDLADVESAPLSRKMNLKWIWVIEVFSHDLQQTRVLHVDHLRLVK